jgi:hypothetical protein
VQEENLRHYPNTVPTSVRTQSACFVWRMVTKQKDGDVATTMQQDFLK